MKLPPGNLNLNPNPYPPSPSIPLPLPLTRTYTSRMIITLKVCGSRYITIS